LWYKKEVLIKKTTMSTIEKQKLSVPVSLAIAGVIILGTVLYLKNDSKITNQDQPIITEKATNTGEHIKGNPEAEILIVEYSDIECPFCKKFHTTMKQLMETYGKDGKIAWQYKNFPLENIHPTAKSEAKAAECAAEIGGNDAYWKYLDTMVEGIVEKDPLKVAEYVGLNIEAFKSCVDKDTFAGIVDGHIQDGLTLGIQGVPYSIFKAKDGREFAISGAYPYEFVELIINMTLAGKSDETVKELIKMVAEGTTPELLEAFLAENYPEALETSTESTEGTSTAE
jgi:protein-disulfide isomerase